QFETVCHHLPPYLKPIVLFGYETGWRLREILKLQWQQVSLEEGWVRLDPGTTKNREGRLAYLSLGLLQILKSQAEATLGFQQQLGIIIPRVFHRDGRPIGSFYKAWRKACRKAGVPGMIFHDLRRTAVRNMVRAGIPERVAMQISGHKTRSVFERYNIVSEGDLREAARKLTLHGEA
ncbi:MAG: site-specific integrase, partial [Dehalococcoidia bacterium]